MSELEFTNWGEPLFHKDLPLMVADASARGISTTVVSHLGVRFSDEWGERLLASGLTVLGCSIDGATQATYEQYRRGGSLAIVLDNCRRMVAIKRRLAVRTRIVWSYHAFAHNVGDVALAQQTAAEIGMEFAATKGAVLGEEWDPEGSWRFFGDPIPVRCPYLWAFATLNNDGGVPPCQGAFYAGDDMGRIAMQDGDQGAATFMEVWNNRRFRAARSLFASRTESDETRDLLCLHCPIAKGHEQLRRHVDGGGRVASFDIGYTTNDVWKYFLDRRGAVTRARQD